MRRFVLAIFVVALAGGGWWFFQNYRVLGLDQLSLSPKAASEPVANQDGAPAATRVGQAGTIRIASFNIQVFGEKKISKPRVCSLLAEVIRNFDLVAIQEIRSKQEILPQFVDAINATGRRYDYVVGPRLGRTASKEQYALIFDTATIEVDRGALYTVGDPDDLFQREPLVGWFRVRGPPPDQAFTFSLVDIHTEPDRASQEVDSLADVFRAVRDDGRGEDDVILLGDLNSDDHHFGRLAQIPHIRWAISGVATNTRGNKLYDNIVFSDTATTEYTGRSGVFDTIREFNLTMEEAIEVSDHMPIWGEFSVYEGGQGSRVATRPFNAAPPR
jgi:deoxyribonuclease-1-like protein